MRSGICLSGAAIAALVAIGVAGSPARAQGLEPGDSGKRVRILQVRVAGWYPRSAARVHFALDGVYGTQTVEAVQALQRHYGLRVDGIAGPRTQAVLHRLADPDTSTAHFNFSEFNQNYNPACSAQANAYAGTFRGGMVTSQRVRRNVRRLMWRLEVLRAKGRGNAIGVNSGFRSAPYNNCIGGARLSQHMFGTAADNRMAHITNHRERVLARSSELHGIGCYASLTHNHFDVRMDNDDLPATRAWWWPRRDGRGRDLDENGNVCWGEPGKGGGSAAPYGAGTTSSLVATVAEIKAFAAAGERRDLSGAD
jgi:zinc D-Ala-D-Ala carboxypeptidase